MSTQPQDMTWSDYAGILRRRWRPAVLTAALVAFGSIYLAYSLPAVYQSSATLLIEQQEIPPEYVRSTVTSYADERLQAIRQRVTAAPVIFDLIERLDLYPEERETLPLEELVFIFRAGFMMVPQNVAAVHTQSGRTADITYGVQLLFNYYDPVKARDVLQEIADRFVTENEMVRREAAARTTAFLNVEAEDMQKRLAELAERIAQFKEQYANSLPESRLINMQSLERAERELNDVDNLLRSTRERKALLETELAETPRFRPVMSDTGEAVLGGVDRLAQAQQELMRLLGRYSDSHPEVVALRREIAALSNSPSNQAHLLQQLNMELSARRQELAAAREIYRENHPDVVSLQRTVSSLEEQLAQLRREGAAAAERAEANNPVYLTLQTRIRTADAEIEDLVRRRAQLTSRLQQFEQRLGQSAQVEREYSALLREQELLATEYRDLRNLHSQALMAETLETGNTGERLTLIDPPRVPATPVSPDRTSFTFLGIVLAIALGLGIASLVEALDPTIRGQRDVYELLEMPPLGIIPYVENTLETSRRVSINIALGVAIVGGGIYVITMALSP